MNTTKQDQQEKQARESVSQGTGQDALGQSRELARASGGEYEPVAGAPVPPDYRPPSHEETLGALPGVPKDVAEEYSRTGRTPQKFVREVRQSVEDARKAGLPANAGTPGQAPYPEDQERLAKEQQRAAQREQQREGPGRGGKQ